MSENKSSLTLKEEFMDMAEQRFEFGRWDWEPALKVCDRMGTFTTLNWGVVAWECDNALDTIKNVQLRDWVTRVREVAIAHNAKYVARGMEAAY